MDGPAPPPDLDWAEVLQIWLRSLWLIVPAAVAFALASLMAPVYEAKSLLLLDRPSSGALGSAADSQPAIAPKATLVNSQIAALLRLEGVAQQEREN